MLYWSISWELDTALDGLQISSSTAIPSIPAELVSAKFCILDMKIMLELHQITLFMFQQLFVMLILNHIPHLTSSPADFI